MQTRNPDEQKIIADNKIPNPLKREVKMKPKPRGRRGVVQKVALGHCAVLEWLRGFPWNRHGVGRGDYLGKKIGSGKSSLVYCR